MRILITTRAFSSFSTFMSLIMSSITALSCALKGSDRGNRCRYDNRVFRKRYESVDSSALVVTELT